MTAGMLSFSSLAHAPSSAVEKRSVFKAFLDRYTDGLPVGALTKAKMHAIEAGHAVRQTSEALLTGAALAVIHAEVGLDVGKGKHKVPADAVAAGLGMVGRAALVESGVGSDIGNVGATCAGVFSFRKTTDFVHAKKAAQGQVPAQQVGSGPAASPAHGDGAVSELSEAMSASDMGEDPVIAEANRLVS